MVSKSSANVEVNFLKLNFKPTFICTCECKIKIFVPAQRFQHDL